MDSSSIIILHSLVHIFLSIKYYRKEGLTLRSFIWIYITIYAVAGVFLLKTGIYEIVTESSYCSESEEISIIPYVLNIIFTYILVNPLGFVKPNMFEQINGSLSSQGVGMLNLCKNICILFSILKLSQIIMVSSYGFGNFHDIGRDAQRSILYGGNLLLILLNYVGRTINICIFPFFITCVLLQWRCKKTKLKTFFKLYILYAFNTISVGLVAGSRASMLYGFLDVSFFLLLFWAWMPLKVKRNVALSCIVILFLFFILSLSIAAQRFDKMLPVVSFLSYLGQSYLNLGFEFWNNLKVHTYGAITMGQIFGVGLPDYFETTGVHDDWFHTAYGAFFEDFGPIIPILIALALSALFRKFINDGKTIGIDKIIGILFYFQLCYQIPISIGFDLFYLFSLFVVIWVPLYLRKQFWIRV